MAPHDTGAAGLAERFPELAAKLRPEPLRGPVVVHPNALPAWDCRDILRAARRDGERRSGVMLPGPDGIAQEVVVADYKLRHDAVLPQRFDEDLYAAIFHRAGIQSTSYLRDRALVAIYGRGGHFSWHRDDMLPEVSNRETAISIALNDPSEYEGGALELPEAGLSIRPPAGALVAFPASALHRVTPVTSGVRKVLLTFILKGTT